MLRIVGFQSLSCREAVNLLVMNSILQQSPSVQAIQDTNKSARGRVHFLSVITFTGFHLVCGYLVSTAHNGLSLDALDVCPRLHHSNVNNNIHESLWCYDCQNQLSTIWRSELPFCGAVWVSAVSRDTQTEDEKVTMERMNGARVLYLQDSHASAEVEQIKPCHCLERAADNLSQRMQMKI